MKYQLTVLVEKSKSQEIAYKKLHNIFNKDWNKGQWWWPQSLQGVVFLSQMHCFHLTLSDSSVLTVPYTILTMPDRWCELQWGQDASGVWGAAGPARRLVGTEPYLAADWRDQGEAVVVNPAAQVAATDRHPEHATQGPARTTQAVLVVRVRQENAPRLC